MACEHYIDSHLDFRWRGKLPDNTTASLSFTTQFNTVESQPIVVQVSSRENSPGKYLVVTANFRPESSPVWTLESLSKIAEKTREIRMSIKSASPP